MSKKQVIKPKILFVEENNDFISQIAEYFTRKFYSDKYEVFSAGPKHDFIDCELISVMYQEGEDMRRQISKDFRDQENLPADAEFDLVIFLNESVFNEWSVKTPWKGKQLLHKMGTVKDFNATDDKELGDCYMKVIEEVKNWVKCNLDDLEKLKTMVTA